MGRLKGKLLGYQPQRGTAPDLREAPVQRRPGSPKSPVPASALITAFLLIFGLLALTLGVVGCGTSGTVGDAGTISTTGGTETTTTSTTEPPQQTTTTSVTIVPTTTTLADNIMTVTVYFVKGEKIAAAHRMILKTLEVGKTAMLELLDGPTSNETAAGMTSAVPTGSTFLGLDIKNGVATVNLSKEYASGGGSLSMALRLAQVVYTLTQFSTAHTVNFELDGVPVDVFGSEGIILNHPVGRAEYEDVTPAIFVESPTVGDTVNSPARITGTANTFEASFIAQIKDEAGATIAEQVVTANLVAGQRGTFDLPLPYKLGKAGNGSLVVFEESAKDGTPINLEEIPVRLEK